MAERNRGYLAGAVAILFLALSWTAVILRVYVRAVMIKTFGIDDYLCVLTLVCLLSFITHMSALNISSCCSRPTVVSS
jgi:hypothetical protein